MKRGREISEPMRSKSRHLLSGLKYGQNKALVDLIFLDEVDTPIKTHNYWPLTTQ